MSETTTYEPVPWSAELKFRNHTSVTKTGELVNGLFIHADMNNPERWRIATQAGLLIDTVTSRHGWKLDLEQARAVAGLLGEWVPEEIKRGEWTGPEWKRRATVMWFAFETKCREIQLALDGFGGGAYPTYDEFAYHLIGRIPE